MKSSSELSSTAIFNTAEICGVMGRYEEQTSLLQLYARLEIGIRNHGSISTLYKLARLSLEEGDAHTAVGRYQYILDECRALGIDVPSPTFFVEFAHALNLISDYTTALNILPPDDHIKSTLARSVCGHTLFLAKRYDECLKMISDIQTSDAITNQAILKYISDDERGSIQILEQARRRFPSEKSIMRTLVLIKYAKPNTIKSGCMMWLTYLGYQLNYEAEFYNDVVTRLTLAGSPDPVTISALSFIAQEKSK
ncbi:TPR-like family [Trichomonas vaginalis G3]|nr:TPR-like family [Trichomonas vaginalis G3]KAI5500492.1 TPR-like family [Trichomonas vaginalis G3]